MLLLVIAGCSVPVANGVDDAEANAISVSLERAGIDAQKEADPTAEGKFRILVARDDTSAAVAVLRDEELPRPHPKGVLDAVGQGSLVPSQTSEHAHYVAGLQGDLERSLNGIDGVLRARVHLNLPSADPLRARDALPKATASVLVEHRGATAPLTVEAVQRLVAGGSPNLSAGDVAVLFVARPPRAERAESRLAHVGPFAVSKGSKVPLQGTLVTLILGLLSLFGVAVGFYARAARLARDAEKQG
jgi:type III secretion protein J